MCQIIVKFAKEKLKVGVNIVAAIAIIKPYLAGLRGVIILCGVAAYCKGFAFFVKSLLRLNRTLLKGKMGEVTVLQNV